MFVPPTVPFSGVPEGPIKFESAYPTLPSTALLTIAAFEHTAIGDNLILSTASGSSELAGKYVLKTVAGIELTVGKVVGFAGDYYTVPGNNAITGNYEKPTPSFEKMKENAKAAADTLAQNAKGYLKAIDALFQKEETALETAFRQGIAEAVAVRLL